jgi:hypothetical protein
MTANFAGTSASSDTRRSTGLHPATRCAIDCSGLLTNMTSSISCTSPHCLRARSICPESRLIAVSRVRMIERASSKATVSTLVTEFSRSRDRGGRQTASPGVEVLMQHRVSPAYAENLLHAVGRGLRCRVCRLWRERRLKKQCAALPETAALSDAQCCNIGQRT